MIAGMVSNAEKQRVGMLIKKRRQQMGLRSQEALAARLGVNRTSVASWETGKHYPGRYLGALEDVLGISLTENVALELPTDPTERELWDLAIKDMPPAETWEVIEEYRRRKRRPA
jgi:ribosome-binding protein aMBF1 (putative translation factor)